MSSHSEDFNDRPPPPFLVHLAYRSGTFFRPEDFSPESLPRHISIYTWPSCTLSELALELAASKPSVLPYPAIGTRLAFQLVYPDLRGMASLSDAQPRYAVKDLGSIVIGQGGLAAETSESGVSGGTSRVDNETGKTLNDARFVVGDFISCAILPPLSDGSVAPASNARRDSGRAYAVRENGTGRGRDVWAGRREGPGRRVPSGEWRRGETLPEPPLVRSRGRGRW
ncbi:Sin3-associated polypeptide Sap18 [Ophiocordyceps camponoti-floridani]|uniref:Sin3-associated polypeptide Sap18 n=1 Tax=Ophiocordyceps camponoti-floridani TaxID=2030778 RepID=A0A8H4VBF0_9HYPO|nr:Sin3-associated polypeptide Sap18 [Ophiocordyceps camponoti-floridani]